MLPACRCVLQLTALGYILVPIFTAGKWLLHAALFMCSCEMLPLVHHLYFMADLS